MTKELMARKQWTNSRISQKVWLVHSIKQDLSKDTKWVGETLFEEEEDAQLSSPEDTPKHHMAEDGLPNGPKPPRRDVPEMKNGKVQGKFWNPIPRFSRIYKLELLNRGRVT